MKPLEARSTAFWGLALLRFAGITGIRLDLPRFVRDLLSFLRFAGFARLDCYDLLKFMGICWDMLGFAGICSDLLEFVGAAEIC